MKPCYTHDPDIKTLEIPEQTKHYWPFLVKILGHKKHISYQGSGKIGQVIMAARITYFLISKADSRSLKVLYSLESLENFKNNGTGAFLLQASL